MLEKIVFFIFSAITLLSALLVVTQRNLIRAALCLMASLFGVAGLFALLDAGFLATMQIFVYAGGIAILIVFAVMMTRRVMDPDTPQMNAQAGASVGLVLVLFIILALVLWPDPITLPEVDLALGQLLVGLGVVIALLTLVAVLVQRLRSPDTPLEGVGWSIAMALVIAVVGVLLLSAWEDGPRLQIAELTLGDIPWPEREAEVDPQTSLVTLGEALVDSEQYVVPFEVASVLLLVAMIGAAYIAFPLKRGSQAEPEPAGADLEPGGEE
jgi:NADH:ubiquinone oxidoreductase subunit 6 (subunit J)